VIILGYTISVFYSGQLGLLSSVRWKMSTGQSAMMLCGWE